MAMVNMNNLLNGKDSRWLQLEVCREFQRNKCTRPDTECKFAHPPANVEVQNGRVTACYDSIKVSVQSSSSSSCSSSNGSINQRWLMAETR
ncbi:protein muscleblind-like isoform X2 [Apis dorsata]|uniref:protein muscleblind-like isoform X2 n=1 Tax=Apis dorsata TaxID=7462 RepID=UPI0012937133|nr:protein muscleblind-like isoform X2 [Apis dorsata]